ncbi:udp-glycosyltransferase 85a8 [Quercus suber]|uniref:Udp-glycosyltransferase 85a8 n=1 Tax=Quercus suber TaxID=58331 RepID=A0AAW0LJ93_QUESU
MISWPFFGDQQTNCRYCCVEWGIAMEADNNVQRDEVEKLVRELIDGEKGKELKKNVMEWKTKANDSTKPGGSSYQNLDKLIALVLLARNV